MSPLIHVVEDDRDHRVALCDLIEAAGYRAEAFADGGAAMAAESRPDLILTDLRMPGMDGQQLLEAARDRDPDCPVVLISGHGELAQAVQAMRAGAEDFLEKPYDGMHLMTVIERGLRSRATRAEIGRLQERITRRDEGGLLGQSAAITALRARIAAIGPTDLDVVITGETGTGKELVARALHSASPRAAGPLVAVNCAALPESLFEIEIFGHVAGAFPGAQDKPGKLEAASGGTLMLDEVEAMPAAIQPKLLRALQERAVERLGENRLRPLDLRVIATSKTDLRPLTLDGSFRADLFYRLAGAEIAVEPLRGLGEDIVLLFSHYAALAAARYGRDMPGIDYALKQQLLRRSWPGNVRELKALAERFALGLDIPDVPAPPAAEPESLAARVAAFEAREIRLALERCRGNTERAAKVLGVARRTLNDKISRYGIRV
ncbi:sigma-54-dependent transcriptional regulator [Alloyangia pacifica]|uniref:Nif-specific regulatory protein n=1 Tax=Alloyangia pacifica TaxID=311180 RepID=A0A1I6SVU1_9RHOB|nr:sigma-54 dependent transcriptional regulator [Alloyangia pacifica]SDG89367.1 two-component system, NtrC family, C4-dicarboxylate transport response regulator DctD [Alloyangia pacifica]SFS81084.1 two-component system, NtrC family, C4-dicarboxylate transport response regulator DctD [Alloyangia pacifica]